MILKNSVLPVKIGNQTFPTTQHYVLSSLLKDPVQQDLLLSYPVEKLQTLFNVYDQEQYMRVVYDACNKFHEKKCRSLQYLDNKTVGSLTRNLIKNYNDFLYKTDMSIPFPSIMGLLEEEDKLFGYNIVGHSLLRMKHLLLKIPTFSDVMSEYIFWKTHPEFKDILNIRGKTYRAILPSPSKEKRKEEERKEEEVVGGYVYENDNHDEEEGEEEGFYPEEVVPIYRDDRVHWIASHANARLDDTRGLGADFLYATETAPTDPFYLPSDVELYQRTDPFFIYKTLKACEYLVGMMQNGHDIKRFLHQPIDSILLEAKNTPELDGTLTTKQRHLIYVEYWNQFMSKTIPYYSFIEKEILYPQNLAGFIRKEYVLDLNERIGQKIKEILFASFLYQVIEKSYPHVAPELKIIVMKREMSKFSADEYETITNKLYHLFFQKKFFLDEEGVRRILLLESFRLTQPEIDHALNYVPCKIVIMTPPLEINNTLLDPLAKVEITIDGKLFQDLFQYLYYRLFIFYGGLSSGDAYQLLHDNHGTIRNNSQLQQVLMEVVQSKKMEYLRQAMLAKYNQYPQIQEILLYSKATSQPITSTDGEDTMALWNDIKVDPTQLQLMKWVVSSIPKGDLHFEKSIYFFFFIQDMMRSMGLLKSLVGKRLQEKTVGTFFQCFYPKLRVITSKIKVSKPIPKEFVSYLHKKNLLTESSLEGFWQQIYPFLFLFQQEKFVPSQLFQEAKKKQQQSVISREDLIKALANVVQCLYQDQDVPNDHFYILTQLISGKDDIPMWSDPSFEMIKEVEEEGDDHPILKEISKKLARKKKKNKPQLELVHYNIIHPFYETRQKSLQEAFQRPSSYDPVVSRASYALAALEKDIHPRRVMFYL
jgi:hypothetical protein